MHPATTDATASRTTEGHEAQRTKTGTPVTTTWEARNPVRTDGSTVTPREELLPRITTATDEAQQAGNYLAKQVVLTRDRKTSFVVNLAALVFAAFGLNNLEVFKKLVGATLMAMIQGAKKAMGLNITDNEIQSWIDRFIEQGLTINLTDAKTTIVPTTLAWRSELKTDDDKRNANRAFFVEAGLMCLRDSGVRVNHTNRTDLVVGMLDGYANTFGNAITTGRLDELSLTNVLLGEIRTRTIRGTGRN